MIKRFATILNASITVLLIYFGIKFILFVGTPMPPITGNRLSDIAYAGSDLTEQYIINEVTPPLLSVSYYKDGKEIRIAEIPTEAFLTLTKEELICIGSLAGLGGGFGLTDEQIIIYMTNKLMPERFLLKETK